MELRVFLTELVSSLTLLDFVETIDLRTEAFTVKGRIYLRQRGFLEGYFNEQTQTVALAWIQDKKRRWGIDRDNLRGWHRHPLENPDDHQVIPAMNIRDMIEELHTVWRRAT